MSQEIRRDPAHEAFQNGAVLSIYPVNHPSSPYFTGEVDDQTEDTIDQLKSVLFVDNNSLQNR